MIFINNVIGIIDKYNFLLFLLFKATNLDKAIGRPICPKLINKEKVGRINIYKDNFSIPRDFAIIILIIRARILVIKPPIRRIIVDNINFCFIIKLMKKQKKYIIEWNNMLLLIRRVVC